MERLRIEEHRTMQQMNQWRYEIGTPQQQRIAALEVSKPWDFTVDEELEFYMTPNPPRRKDEQPGPKEWSRFIFPIRISQILSNWLPTIQMEGE